MTRSARPLHPRPTSDVGGRLLGHRRFGRCRRAIRGHRRGRRRPRDAADEEGALALAASTGFVQFEGYGAKG